MDAWALRLVQLAVEDEYKAIKLTRSTGNFSFFDFYGGVMSILGDSLKKWYIEWAVHGRRRKGSQYRSGRR